MLPEINRGKCTMHSLLPTIMSISPGMTLTSLPRDNVLEI